MWDFLETVFGIIVIFLFALFGGILFLCIGIALLPVMLIVMSIIGIVWLIDSITNLINVCKGKQEKHILNITIEEDDN